MSEATKISPEVNPEALYYNTNAPDTISDELMPVVEELGLVDNCRQLATEGYTVIENAASLEFNEAFRSKILEISASAASPS